MESCFATPVLKAGYAGKKEEARTQYQNASALDLSEADKAELARQMQGKV